MDNESKDENLNGNVCTTKSSFSNSTTTSSSQEERASLLRGTADSKFYVPLCGSVFLAMASIGLGCSYALRASLSVAIVAMVNQTALTDDDVKINISNITDDQCPRDPALQGTDGEFVWDRHQQGTALTAFYYGYAITMVGSYNTRVPHGLQIASLALFDST